ncbi:flagellar basal body rod protein FlgC [Bartonella sp. DGB2]|uniref:flagellar basal body rod protein FlgC n=1 Tax=Bartonella sp. DGB2 TaxID=3388426 RepID=UPI00398FCA77
MADPLFSITKIATSGLDVQSARLRIIAENIANSNSTGRSPGADPYRRKTISFEARLGQSGDVDGVRVARIGADRAPFVLKYEPSNLAAGANGYVKYPNVNAIVEMADMREANRSYEANLQVYSQAQDLISQTIDLLRS